MNTLARQQEAVIVNGLDTTALSGLINMVDENPGGGRVTFLSRTSWQDGARSFTRFSGYKVDGQMQHQSERNLVVLGDEPVELSGTDAAPGPIEELMYAAATCIAATINANAALRNIELRQLEVALESDIDLHGIFNLEPKTRPGISEMRAKITIAGEADPATLREIAQAGYQFSPVRDSVDNGVTVKPNIVVSS
ncbi:MAG: OsmC family protein [Anaerolineales bacterium]|nr:OsmC family protein [Anaerolineales bacterium]